jgi:hypothetical protein
MNPRPLVLLYPAAALTLAVLVYLARLGRRVTAIEDYLRPLQEYARSRPNSL